MIKISFRDFLSEKAMNMATFADTEKRLGETAQVGFEFEIVVPQSSAYYNERIDDRNTQVISFFDDLTEFMEYFEAPRSTWREIERDFDDWVEHHRNAYVEDGWHDFVEDEEEGGTEEKARERAGEEFDVNERDKFEFRKWIREDFSNNAEFVERYALEPKYGWYTEPPDRYASIYTQPEEDAENGGILDTLKDVANSLFSVIDSNVIVHNEYHETSKDLKSWYVEPDSSINGGHGVEIVSPPQPLKKALSDLEDVCEWISGDGLETNESTGFHINVSVPGIAEKLDRVKLALFLGERYAAELFDRVGNTYAAEHLSGLIRRIKDSGRIPGSFSGMQKMAQNLLKTTEKYMTINFSNIDRGYLEFRFAGNAGYEKDVDKLKKSVLRCVTAVEIACDPSAEKQEYVKKIVNMFNKAKASAEQQAVSTELVPLEMSRLVKIDPRYFKSNLLRLLATENIDHKRNLLIDLMSSAIALTKGIASEVNIKELAYLKRKAKEYGATPQAVDDYFGTDTLNAQEANVQRRAEFKKVYRI